MVREEEFRGGRYHTCEDCHLHYEDKSWADRCEDWCTRNGTCNLDITRNSLEAQLAIDERQSK